MLNRFPLNDASGFLHTPFDFKKAVKGLYTPLCSQPCLLRALHAVRINLIMPGSDFCTSTGPDEGIFVSKCVFSHCNSVDDAVSAIPTTTCIPQKKLFKDDKFDCSPHVPI